VAASSWKVGRELNITEGEHIGKALVLASEALFTRPPSTGPNDGQGDWGPSHQGPNHRRATHCKSPSEIASAGAATSELTSKSAQAVPRRALDQLVGADEGLDPGGRHGRPLNVSVVGFTG